MLGWLHGLIHRRRELDADHPLRRSRELVTEARLRTARSQRMIERIEAGVSPFEKDIFAERPMRRGRDGTM